MLSISHSLTGAFVASKLPHPALYIPITLGLHYLEDWIPHWDVGTGLGCGKRGKLAAFSMEIVDLVITVGLVFLFWQRGSQNIEWHIWMGALAGIVPDLVEAPHVFLGWKPKFLKHVYTLHKKAHRSIPNKLLGLAPQLGLVALLWGLR